MTNRELRQGGSKAPEVRYWFPAKRRGWGWGPPAVWQGWAVLIVFYTLVAAGAVVLLPSQGPLVFVAYCALLVVALVGICYVKGERPRWRSGR